MSTRPPSLVLLATEWATQRAVKTTREHGDIDGPEVATATDDVPEEAIAWPRPVERVPACGGRLRPAAARPHAPGVRAGG